MYFLYMNQNILKDLNKTFLIAEACENHLGNMDNAYKMIDLSKKCGADAIKFQHHLPDEEMLKENFPTSSNFNIPLYEFLKKNSLSLKQHNSLHAYCKKIGIIYMCTPFSYKAAIEIKNLVEIFKIGSGEFSDHTSLEKISKLNKPMILSTGMSTNQEIKETYDFMKKQNIDFAFLNCLSEYPPKYEDLNLNYIKTMKEVFSDIIIGHSDHTSDNYSSFAAVTLGARIIEKHVILDKNMVCPDQHVSIDFNQLKDLVDGIRKIEKSLGNVKKINKDEQDIRNWAHRSVVTIKDIHPGEKFSEDNLWVKRPGVGIPSKKFNEIIGRKSSKFINKDQLLNWDDIEKN